MPTDMKILSVAVPNDLEQALRVLHARHGTPVSEAIRRALRAYLERQKVLKPEKRHARGRSPR
jgi:metal-responsive CopG/Arc/MetJ family transcriptional regulator